MFGSFSGVMGDALNATNAQCDNRGWTVPRCVDSSIPSGIHGVMAGSACLAAFGMLFFGGTKPVVLLKRRKVSIIDAKRALRWKEEGDQKMRAAVRDDDHRRMERQSAHHI